MQEEVKKEVKKEVKEEAKEEVKENIFAPLSLNIYNLKVSFVANFLDRTFAIVDESLQEEFLLFSCYLGDSIVYIHIPSEVVNVSINEDCFLTLRELIVIYGLDNLSVSVVNRIDNFFLEFQLAYEYLDNFNKHLKEIEQNYNYLSETEQT